MEQEQERGVSFAAISRSKKKLCLRESESRFPPPPFSSQKAQFRAEEVRNKDYVTIYYVFIYPIFMAICVYILFLCMTGFNLLQYFTSRKLSGHNHGHVRLYLCNPYSWQGINADI